MHKYFFKKLVLEIPENLYFPREDSELMAGNIKAEKNSLVLDMGTGSGLQALVALSQGAGVLASDINGEALEACKKNAELNKLEKNLSLRKSNLFEKIPEKFGLILFNPPYVPTGKIKFPDTDAGKRGRKIIDKFLQEMPKHLQKNGKCLMIQSSLNGIKETEKKLEKMKLKFKIIDKEKIFFEELVLFEIAKQ